MRVSKLQSFDEVADAERILRDGFPTGVINIQSMYTLAKYYRSICGFGEARIKKALVDFCKLQNPSFNPVLEDAFLRKWVMNAMKYEIKKAKPVIITRQEVETIKEVKDAKKRKLLFVALVLAKYNHKTDFSKYFITYNNRRDMVVHCKFSMKENDVSDALSEFVGTLLTLYNPEQELVRLNYVYPDSEAVLEIKDFGRLMDYFKDIFGDTISCARCGVEVERTSNRTKYCPECAKIISKERNRVYMKKTYQVKKVT